MITKRTLLGAAAIVMAAACSNGSQQQAYVELLGTDTLSIEVYTRSHDRIEGRLLTRSPVTRVADYVAELSPDGVIDRLEVRYATPSENPTGPPAEVVVVTLDGDTAFVERTRDETDTIAVPVPAGTVPVVSRLPMPVAFLEFFVRRAVAAGADEYPFSYLAAGRSRVSRNAITRRSADTVTMDFFGSPIYVAVDGEGRVLGVSGRATTLKVEIRPVDAGTLDFDVLAADFAERDARGAGIGVASPPDTVLASGGGATFEIYYSQPAKRGRLIWGGLVPYDTIWRTGANAATQFVTSRNLRIGDARVPAGAYSLWTTFSAEAATLIINEQTGQWGTAYDASRDLVHVPMSRVPLSDVAERFTISIEETPEGGVLKLAWDDTEFSVPMRVIR